MSWKTLCQMDLYGKRVLTRVDLNVPMVNGKIADATRIEKIVPTVNEITKKGGTPILLAHMGRPKGKRLQNKVKELLLESFNQLEEDDIRSAIMGETGEDIKLSPAARKLIPYSFECKNQEKLNIWDSLNQAEENSGVYTPVLIFKRNRSKTYAVLNIDKFIELINENSKPSK